jgi:hypothetical protein
MVHSFPDEHSWQFKIIKGRGVFTCGNLPLHSARNGIEPEIQDKAAGPRITNAILAQTQKCRSNSGQQRGFKLRVRSHRESFVRPKFKVLVGQRIPSTFLQLEIAPSKVTYACDRAAPRGVAATNSSAMGNQQWRDPGTAIERSSQLLILCASSIRTRGMFELRIPFHIHPAYHVYGLTQ